MSQENVEIVRSIYEAINRADWDALSRYMHPNVEMTTPPRGTDAGTYRGREEIMRYSQGWMDAFDAWNIEPEEIFESGDQVAVFSKRRLRPKGSSAEIETRNGSLWTIRDGKVASWQIFPKPEEALEAAGLWE
jgi:ketosteroid isomerase-like protein